MYLSKSHTVVGCLLLLTEAGDLELLVNIQLNKFFAKLVSYHTIANDYDSLLPFHCGHDAVALAADMLRPAVKIVIVDMARCTVQSKICK
jgi:hypothetical protein